VLDGDPGESVAGGRRAGAGQRGILSRHAIGQPANAADAAWAHFTNVTGLVAGTTKLGDELGLLYDAPTIAGSVFAGALDWVWNGTAFAAAP